MRLRHRPPATLADEHPRHPDRPLTAAAAGEPPTAPHPGNITLDVHIEIVGYHLHVAVATGGYLPKELLAGQLLIRIGTDVHRTRAPRQLRR
jgi:hypothetical protein